MQTYLVTIAVGLNLILSLTILWTSLCALNEMDRSTGFLRRVAFVLLGTGAFASLLAPLYLQRAPTATELLLVTAVAVLRITDIMKKHPHPAPAHAQRPPYRNPSSPTAQRKDS